MSALTRRRALAGLAGATALAMRPAFATDDRRPRDQRMFEAAALVAYSEWQMSAANEVRRALIVGNRARGLVHAMGGRTAFASWLLQVVAVGVDGEGHAHIALASTESLPMSVTFTNAATTPDDRHGQRLALGSPVYKVAERMKSGDLVVASGELFADDEDGFRELGGLLGKPLQERIQDPLFAVRWTEMRRP